MSDLRKEVLKRWGCVPKVHHGKKDEIKHRPVPQIRTEVLTHNLDE